MTHRLLRQALLTVVIASASGLVAPAGAQPPKSGQPSRAARFTFADGRISFMAPPGFTALTAEELAVKYPNAQAPRQAVGNERVTTSIAYDLLEHRALPTELEALRLQLLQGFAQLPKLKWVASDVRPIAGRDWAYVEFTAATADQDIHNIVLLSVYDGRVLLFNFNSTVVEFPRVERALRASMATISTKP